MIDLAAAAHRPLDRRPLADVGADEVEVLEPIDSAPRLVTAIELAGSRSMEGGEEPSPPAQAA